MKTLPYFPGTSCGMNRPHLISLGNTVRCHQIPQQKIGRTQAKTTLNRIVAILWRHGSCAWVILNFITVTSSTPICGIQSPMCDSGGRRVVEERDLASICQWPALCCRSATDFASLATGCSSVEPSGQRIWSAVMGEALVMMSVAEFCDQ